MASEMKWTKGPWKAGNRYGAAYAIEGSDERGICSTGGYSSNVGDQDAIVAENLANAHLIAAAPELYEALERAQAAVLSLGMWELGGAIVERTDGSGADYQYPIRDELASQIEKALAKARGEQP